MEYSYKSKHIRSVKLETQDQCEEEEMEKDPSTEGAETILDLINPDEMLDVIEELQVNKKSD